MRKSCPLILLLLSACAAEQGSDQPVEGDDPWKSSAREALSEGGRWALSGEAQAASDGLHVSYDGAPAWTGSSGCSGTFTDGARALGDYLVANFDGTSHYEGYSCRQNTADTSRTSMHGTGRAIDVFVPLDGGEADNGLGDPIANWLVVNAEAIGVQLVIWDRTIWNASRTGEKDRAYGGPHPHHDHLHVEVTEQAAAQGTPWFEGDPAPPSGDEPPPTEEDAPTRISSATCLNTCTYASDGECDDGGPGSDYSLCDLGTDCDDCGIREE